MNKFYVVLGVVALGGLGLVGSSMMGGTTAAEPVDLTEMEDQALIDLAQGQIFGDPDAAITIMEFGDYQCPACGNFAMSVKPQLEMAYIETGQAKLVFHDFPLTMHPHAFLAARAAWCASDEDRYFDYHDALFSSQRDWSAKSDATASFFALADDLGLDAGDFKSCLQSEKYADVVSANQQLGFRLGVGGTPTLFVKTADGQVNRLGGFQFSDVQAVIDAATGND